MQFPFIIDDKLLYINDSIPRNTNIEQMYGILTFLNCYFFQYFVGSNYMLAGLHVPTNFQMYRQIFKCTDKTPKIIIGGSCLPLPPPPPHLWLR